MHERSTGRGVLGFLDSIPAECFKPVKLHLKAVPWSVWSSPFLFAVAAGLQITVQQYLKGPSAEHIRRGHPEALNVLVFGLFGWNYPALRPSDEDRCALAEELVEEGFEASHRFLGLTPLEYVFDRSRKHQGRSFTFTPSAKVAAHFLGRLWDAGVEEAIWSLALTLFKNSKGNPNSLLREWTADDERYWWPQVLEQYCAIHLIPHHRIRGFLEAGANANIRDVNGKTRLV
jgi:hypothetical protein